MAESTRDHSNPTPPDNNAIMAQLIRMTEMMDAMRSDLNTVITGVQALKSTFRPTATQQTTTPQSTPPAPQEAKKEEANYEENTEITAEKQEQEPRQQPLYQATVEDMTESIAEKETQQQHGSSKLSSDKPDSKTTLSTIPRLYTTPTSGDPTACFSNALLFAYQHTLNLACQHALILGLMFNTPLFGYIEHSEGMEATGQG